MTESRDAEPQDQDHPIEKRVDSEWKRRVSEERERVRAGQTKKAARTSTGADLRTLVATLAAQAQATLGLSEHPATGERMVDLPSAKVAIDLLAVLEEKTRGNLDEDEKAFLSDVLYQLRMLFVQVQQATGGGRGGAGGAPPNDRGPAPRRRGP